MRIFNTLLLREWMQQRFGWALMVLVPLAIALVTLSFARVNIDIDSAEAVGEMFPAMLAVISLTAGTAVIFLILTVTSMFLVSGLARRDHGDRSVEFWLSMPTSHPQSLAAPLLTHLILVPVAALVIGALCGLIVSVPLVGRLASLADWAALPWGGLLAAGGAVLVRVAIGVPLAVMWLAPLILGAVLAGAVLKRWGLPVFVIGLALVVSGAQQLLGVRWPGEAIATMFGQAARSLIHTRQQSFVLERGEHFADALPQVPGFMLGDIPSAFGLLLSPAFAGVLAVSALLFVLLVEWRKRGASASA